MINGKIKLSATNINAFSDYLLNKWETEPIDIINKLNKVKIEPSEAMEKGSAFHKALSMPDKHKDGEIVIVNDIELFSTPLNRIKELVSGGIEEVYVETEFNNVKIYGYIDFLKSAR